MIRIGIVGGAGYTAGELLRILLHDPGVEITFVHSNSQAGQPVSRLHPDLLGETELHFTDQINPEVDLIFVCAGHGKTRPLLEAYRFPPEMHLIDLSSDFRIMDESHSFIYGLPELNREAIRKAKFVANPGCFATAIQLALLPLAQAQALQHEVHIHAITGSTGAGQQPRPTTHFSWRNNNLSVYKAFRHQHLAEIRQSLAQLQEAPLPDLHFLPLRGDFTRGIFASLYLHSKLGLAAAWELYEAYYQDHPFVVLADENPNLKQVVNTNKAVLYLEEHEGKLLVISMIDNLLKGASGQAIQNMNLMFGRSETQGLKLKAAAF